MVTVNPVSSDLLTRAELLKTFPTFKPRKRVVEELGMIYSECNSPGWDGNGAHGIMWRVVEAADAFLGFLPEWIPDPELSPEPDGEICIDWNVLLEEGTRPFSISIGALGGLSYAGVMRDGSTVSGYLTPSLDSMKEIESLLKRFFWS